MTKRARQVVQKICSICSKPFIDKKGSNKCWPCVNAARRIPCTDCKILHSRQGSALRCVPCANRHKNQKKRKLDDLYVTTKGYVRIYRPSHPKSCKGWIAEHTVVMEQHIGRFLVDGENVHHKNGVKNENKIDNLELWCKPQPTGARAADIYRWAKEITERYKSLFGEATENRTPTTSVTS